MTDDKFIERINLFLDDEISPEELSLLIDEIKVSGKKRRLFSEYCYMNDATRMAFFRDPELFQKDYSNPVEATANQESRVKQVMNGTDGETTAVISRSSNRKMARFRNLMSVAACLGFSIASVSFFYKSQILKPAATLSVNYGSFDVPVSKEEPFSSSPVANNSDPVVATVSPVADTSSYSPVLADDRKSGGNLNVSAVNTDQSPLTPKESQFAFDALTVSNEFSWEDPNLTPEILIGIFQEGNHAGQIDFSNPEMVRQAMDALFANAPESRVIWSSKPAGNTDSTQTADNNRVPVKFGR